MTSKGSPQYSRPTIKDVAKLAKVDPSLVSRIVNNDPRASATEATKERVRQAVKQLGYRANNAARGLRMSKTHSLGLSLPDLTNPMYASMVAGAQKASAELNYGLILAEHPEIGEASFFQNLLTEGRVDGLLIASGLLTDKFMSDIANINLGHVLPINRVINGIDSSVTVDDCLGAEIAVNHLADLGHKKIVGLFGPMFIDTARRRLLGFEKTCKANNLNGQVIECKGVNAKIGYEETKKILATFTTSAIFVSTFYMAIGVLRAAREMGYEVPKKLSVIALHDSELADYLAPALTTVSMPTERMGAQAAHLLVELLNGGQPRHIVVNEPPVLCIRDSTAPF